eukprot:7554351-Prorocentrum_lima.AAC.1
MTSSLVGLGDVYKRQPDDCANRALANQGMDGRDRPLGDSPPLECCAYPVSYTHLTLPTICSV